MSGFSWMRTRFFRHPGEEVHIEVWAPRGERFLAMATRYRLAGGGPKVVAVHPLYYAGFDYRLVEQIPGEPAGSVCIPDKVVEKFSDLRTALDWLVRTPHPTSESRILITETAGLS
jgi:hypothetical protein